MEGPGESPQNAMLCEAHFGLCAVVGREFRYNPTQTRRDGRVAEGGGLLNRYRVKSSIGGSNPPLSARNL
jgi:hypothetical protein